MTKHNVEFCYKELQPLLQHISRAVKAAPLSENERKGLAMMILADMAGTTLAVIGLEPTQENMSQLGEFMASAFSKEGMN
jgi:hypothetical protein